MRKIVLPIVLILFFSLIQAASFKSSTDNLPPHLYNYLNDTSGFSGHSGTQGTRADIAPPTGHISNGLVNVSFYVPDADKGFYRGTRFDWSGIIYSLLYKGEEYYDRWYTSIDPSIYNNVQRVRPDGTGEVVTGIASSGQGPSEEFLTKNIALGFDEAKAGGTFLKIGVGVLRRPDDKPYDRYLAYEIVDGGKWTTEVSKDKVVFTQKLSNKESGYGYVYTKTIRLLSGKPVMRIEHKLDNTGTKPLISSVYDHNFFVTHNHYTGPDYIITTTYPMKSRLLVTPDLTTIEGNKLMFNKPLATEEMVALMLEGFGPTAKDYFFRVENIKTGTGYSVQGDRPLDSILLWAIFTNISMESFINLHADPGKDEQWAYEYLYFTGK